MFLDFIAFRGLTMLFTYFNIHILEFYFLEGILMCEGVCMTDFSPEYFEPVIPVGLEDVIALLVDILSTLIVKIYNVDFILTG